MQTRIITKWVVTVFLIGFVLLAYGAPVSRVTNFVDGQVLTASQLNSEFNNVIGGVNSINNSQIATNAQIAPSKIAATIKGDAIERNGSTGALSVKVDDSTIGITADQILVKDDGITTDKIADGAVTQDKLGTKTVAVSSSSGIYTNTTISFNDVTNLSVSLTTTGRPVVLALESINAASPSNSGYVETNSVNSAGTSGTLGFVTFLRDSTAISSNRIGHTPNDSDKRTVYPCSGFRFLDSPSAGTYTYKVQVALDTNAGNNRYIGVINCKLVAYEL